MEQRPLHWSERAKMFPGSAESGGGKSQSPQPPKSQKNARDKQPSGKQPKNSSSHKGFLITLLVILVLAAAGAAIFLWYLPTRDSGGEQAELDAKELMHEAMSAVDTAYQDTGTYDPQTMDPGTLQDIAPSITFNPVSDTSAATAPTSHAKDGAVDYSGTETSYALGTISDDGTTYGVIVERQEDSSNVTYYLNGQEVETWDQATDTTGAEPTDAGDDATDQPTQTTITGPVADAMDVEAMTLVRNAMTTVESSYASVGTFEPASLSASLLGQMDPSLTFVIRDSDQAAKAPVSSAAEMSLDYYGDATSYALGTKSDSGATFGVIVNKGNSTTTYYVNGQEEDWSTQLVQSTVG